MSQPLYQTLAVKAATTLASTLGSKVGGALAGEVLEQLGFVQDQFGEVMEGVQRIEDRLDQMEALLRQIEGKLDWLHNDDVFSSYKSKVDSYLRRAKAIINDDSITSSSEREGQVRRMLNEADAAAIETGLTAIHNMYMGNDGAVETNRTLPQTMFTTRWEMFGTSSRSLTIRDAANIALGVYNRIADYQMKGAALVYLRHMVQENREEGQARDVLRFVTGNLRTQYRELVARAPGLLAYIMSGFPEGGTGSNWSITMKAVVPGITDAYLVPVQGMYWEGEDVMESQFSGAPQEINLVPDPGGKGRFYLRELGHLRAMSFSTKQFMSDPGADPHAISSGDHVMMAPGRAPVFTDYLTVAFDLPDGHANRAIVDFYTTEKADRYVFGDDDDGFASVHHFHSDPGVLVQSMTGARSMDRFRVIVFDTPAFRFAGAPTSKSLATVWEVKLFTTVDEMIDRLTGSGLM